MVAKKFTGQQEILESFSERGRLAVEAALAGGEAVLSVGARRDTVAKDGGDHDYVTAGDKASEKAVIDLIRSRFPNDAILSEESFSELPNPQDIENLWLIDPIDGTFNYSREIPYCGVSVGYAENGIIKAGTVFNPFTGELYFAEHEKGAYKNGKRIHVGTNSDLESAVVDTDLPSNRESRRLNHAILSGLNLYSHIRGSLVLNASRVAAGNSDLYYVTRFGGPWDLAASISIVQEAGGVVYDLEGNDFTNKKGSFLAKTIVFGNRDIVRQFTDAVKPIIGAAGEEVTNES